MILKNRLFIFCLYLITLSAFISLTACLKAGNAINEESTSETNRLNKWFAV
jgi:hypothetical protein